MALPLGRSPATHAMLTRPSLPTLPTTRTAPAAARAPQTAAPRPPGPPVTRAPPPVRSTAWPRLVSSRRPSARDGEARALAMAHDAPRRRVVEVGAEDGHR